MKFTSEDLMKAMGLNVGDKIIVNENEKPSYEVIKEQNIHKLKSIHFGTTYPLSYLINMNFEILPRPKRVGDLKCSQFDTCETCPLQFICNLYDSPFNDNNSLYNILTKIDVYDQEIHDLLKARLDKEVLSND